MRTSDDALCHDAAVRAAAEAQARGRLGLALDLFEESLAHALALGERRLIHAARINVSSCYLSLGEPAQARTGLPAVILESDNPIHVSAAAAQLAEGLMREGRLEKAGHYLKLAATQARQAGDAAREAGALGLAGHLAVLEGRHRDAVESFGAALELIGAAPPEARGALAYFLDNLGYAQLVAGDVAPGLGKLRRALSRARAIGNPRVQAEVRVDLAFGFLLAGRNRSAERHALRGLALAHEHGYPGVEKNATYLLMELSLRAEHEADFDRYFAQLQQLLPDVKLSRDFFRIFDISDVINIKEF